MRTARLPDWLARLKPGRILPGRDRGQNARRPSDIPAAGWADIAVRTLKAAQKHGVTTISAGVTFFLMLAFIPALSAVAALLALFGKSSTGLWTLGALHGLVPADALTLITSELNRQAHLPASRLAWTAVAGLGGATCSLNAGVLALLSGLNVAYGEEETRGWLRRTILAGVFTILILVLAPTLLSSLLIGQGIDDPIGRAAVRGARLCWLAAAAAALLALLYRYGPSRKLARWRWVTPGGLLAAGTWTACSLAVTYYLGHVAHYQAAYGLLGALLAVMIWFWTACTVVVLGAELNAQLELQTARSTAVTGGGVRRHP